MEISASGSKGSIWLRGLSKPIAPGWLKALNSDPLCENGWRLLPINARAPMPALCKKFRLLIFCGTMLSSSSVICVILDCRFCGNLSRLNIDYLHVVRGWSYCKMVRFVHIITNLLYKKSEGEQLGNLGIYWLLTNGLVRLIVPPACTKRSRSRTFYTLA